MQGNKAQEVLYIRHNEIDEAKWEKCISEAQNSRVYANTWHLDRAAGVWDALVWGDYEYVMPLPVRKKLGVRYVYQPLFCQQLGIFPEPSEEMANLFYQRTEELFSFAETQLNAQNIPSDATPARQFISRKNYLLALNHSYNRLYEGFSKNTKRNIEKAKKRGLTLTAGIRLEEYLDFKRINRQKGIEEKTIAVLKSIIAFGQYKGTGEIYGVYSGINELCAAVYFCRWKERVVFMNAATSAAGKEQGGMFFLLDGFIRENAGKNLTIDFEGSTIPGVARFYAGFGAMPETYYQFKMNRLPIPLRWLKR